ncbi:FAD-dependent monooxygenase [Halobacillus litoralis]|uniref:NAD(P)/FAD-dependent oxidoreductase n=1 Tax=Halobacillus litoralis TaxID=45668 RepID=UPI001CD52E0E|nr:NAD(P)/FAD-dependent oxidoreductase [Halobacillus litoralis]MCA0971157.1 FAD-dependent monooxygenase [Halobacillus litoralis]
MKQHDVIIVGARVAGSSLAILLAKQGKSVLLVDKASFPSDTLSTHHMSHTEYLKELGVLEEVEKTGLRKIERMRTYIGSAFVEGPRASYTIIPRRDHLDYVLLKKAESFTDVEVMERTTVTNLVWEGEQVRGIEVVDQAGRTEQIEATWVVGADGKHSQVARFVEAAEYETHEPLRPVLYGYFKGIEPLSKPTTEIFLQEGRIGFLFPMEEGRDCLGIEIHPDEFKDMMKQSKESFEAMYREHYDMDRRMEGAELEGKIIGTKGMPNHFRQAYGKGWALIGDAGHSKDPSTGLGINDAFMQSFLLAEALNSEDEETALQAYQQKRDEQLMPGFQLTIDYIKSLRKWTTNEVALFQSMAANPMVWNKIVPRLADHLKAETGDMPLLHGSVLMEAQSFGYE